jgi:glucose dehydrogenase
MINRRLAGGAAAIALAMGTAFACALPFAGGQQATQASIAAAALARYDSTEWKYWGGDGGQTRYAPLEQINASNVNRLKIAWRWSADTSGDASSSNYKSTPLLDDGVLYVPWVNHGMDVRAAACRYRRPRRIAGHALARLLDRRQGQAPVP